MAYSRLQEILSAKECNYILPFCWLHGDHTERIPAQIESIRKSGCRAICVEARPHKDFGGAGWWQDMDVVLAECQKRDMKVWLLDDDHFPTGHANGLISKKYPHLRPWELIERHVDVVGPMREASIFLPPENEENILLGAYAYRRYADDEETCHEAAVALTDCVENGTLLWDIPDGVWRVFFYYRSRQGAPAEYIDVINPASVDVLIEAVYEPHWEHYKNHFGNTFAGFFSDEPGFKNQYQGRRRIDAGAYEKRIGRQALALPYNDEVRERMQATLGFDPIAHFNLLWYNGEEETDLAAKMRHAYMDAITAMYQEYFCKRLGNWCHAHGVEYIGHIIEDNGCHTRMSYGAGHYFRSMDGQDMAGMDIVLHQVMPGMSDYTHSATLSSSFADGRFFHYTLAKLCASLSHIKPEMQKRAMCEIFGAYGWSEGTPFMKWLIDFLLVRGVNHFVPHAFSSRFPDPDCPPHFGGDGHDPSFEGFSALMQYTNRATHLLFGGTHVANAALLYHAEAEWANKIGTSMPVDAPAKELADHHIDYDIVPMDYLSDARVENRKLLMNDESFDCLIIPAAKHLPAHFYPTLKKLHDAGLPVWFVDRTPIGYENEFEAITLDALAEHMKAMRMTDVSVPDGYEKLRIYHTKNEGHDVFFLFNEDYAKAVDTRIHFPACGKYVKASLLENTFRSACTEDGNVDIKLLPNESLFLIFGEDTAFPEEITYTKKEVLHPTFSLALADYRNPWKFEHYGSFDTFFNVTSPRHRPDFSGKMKYVFSFDSEASAHAQLDLGTVGEVAELTLNGIDCGIRIAKPYRFDISSALKEGKNVAEIIVSNHLGYALRDQFSYNMQNAPSGILGEITLKYTEKEQSHELLDLRK